MRKLLMAAVCVTAVIVGVCAGAALAKPHVSLSLPDSANARAAVPFSYSARGLPRGSFLALQRQEGTGHVWRTVLSLRKGANQATLGAPPLGRYAVRLVVLDARRRVLAQQQRTLAVFGNVPFSQLFNVHPGGVYTTPTATFPYVLSDYDGRVDYTWFTISPNPCRSVNFQWVAGQSEGYDDSAQSGTVTLVQQAADPVAVTEPGNSLGTINAALTPGQSWSMNVSQSEGDPTDFLFTWYMNGSANCDASKLNFDEPGGF